MPDDDVCTSNPASPLHIFLNLHYRTKKKNVKGGKALNEGRKERARVAMGSKEDAYSTPRTSGMWEK